ncbi:aminopeptidase N [Scaptodrosophila lebanonensis]|uniref:Aminopeptidase n=1 Tax=Drosophila lebanonensis TaxID=7225 RepID=A0A6J2T4A9_DROLE|nr:aminopeptidase N [Scaptodrosophila lebanonensis]
MARFRLISCFLLVVASFLPTQASLLSPLDDGQLETKGYYKYDDRPLDVGQHETKGYYKYDIISPRADEVANYRLPNNTEPVHYDVELTTNVHTGERAFVGVVSININVIEDTRTIVLHARQTTSTKATIRDTESATSTDIPLTIDYNSTLEFLSLTPEDNSVNFLAGTKWQLTIEYNGTLRADMGGFYLSSYTDANNEVHYLATTQFESTNARHAFPCYDEPAKRATFTITINHSPTYNAISNMPVNAERSSEGVTAFDTTPIMSTYLLAFIISDFEYTEGSFHGLPQRVYSRKGSTGQQQWALWSGLLLESSLANYFDVPFKLPKLYQAAIPDFSAGAMENWGLATYREQYMLWTKEGSTVNAKTNIANIIGHEYAHMWFGDLVSIQWWTYLWLKEGFATIFSYESDDIAYPEWNIYQIFHVSDYNSALINDAAETATPMTHYVQTPSEISGRYNTFSYAKPASVLYMFKNAWTDPVFRLGLHKYLTDNEFQSCDEWDLFDSLQQAADELNYNLPTTVANIFSSWSQQAGYPLLTVERNYEDGSFTIKQERYSNDKSTTNSKNWYVPINYAVASNPDFRDTSASFYLLNEPTLKVANDLSSNDWLILNKQSTGYYRILYDERNLELIADGLIRHTHKIHPRNRAQLLHDTYRFVATERLSQGTLLNLLVYLKNEDQYAPWSIANSIFATYDQYLRGDANYNEFQLFVINLVEDFFDKIGVNEVPGEHYLNNYLRVVLISLACQVGSEKCYVQSNNKLKQGLRDGIKIEPTLQNQIYCNGLRQTEDALYNDVLNLLLNSTIASNRVFYISALGCSQTKSQLSSFIEASIDTNNILLESERTSILSSAYSRGEVGLTASLEFLELNWEEYGKLGTGSSKPLDTAIRGIASYVVSESQRTRLNALVETVSGSELVNADLDTRVEAAINANFEWLNLHRDPLLNWIIDYQKEEEGNNGGGDGSGALTASITTIVCALMLALNKLF